MYSRIANIPNNKSFFLFGPRQTGKSTLIKAKFLPSTTIFYNLLDARERVRLSADPELLRTEVMSRDPHITHIVIDEIQRVPALLDVVHHVLESLRPPHFVLTGSSARSLKREHANLLAGRAVERNLFPLTHRELGPAFDLIRCLTRGTLPQFYDEKSDVDANDKLVAYISTYLTEEIQYEAKLRNIGPFSRFLLAAAGGIGEQLNYKAIARQTQTADKTIKEYFQILEDTLIGFFLLSYNKSPRKRLSSHPKFYFFDTGILRAILRQESSPVLPGSRSFGELFEVWVINETRRLLAYSGERATFSFFRVEKGPELDLIIDRPDGSMWAVEIKSNPQVQLAEVRSAFESFSKCEPKARKIVVTTTQRRRLEGDIEFLPWQEFFDLLVVP